MGLSDKAGVSGDILEQLRMRTTFWRWDKNAGLKGVF
jgi:hypothetical protein